MDYEERPDWQTLLFPGACWLGSWIAVIVFVCAGIYSLYWSNNDGNNARAGVAIMVVAIQCWLAFRFMLVVIEIRDKIGSGKGQ